MTYLIPIVEIVMFDECDCVRTSIMLDEDGPVDNVGRIPDAWLDGFGG